MARHELRKVSQSTYILAAVLCGKPPAGTQRTAIMTHTTAIAIPSLNTRVTAVEFLSTVSVSVQCQM